MQERERAECRHCGRPLPASDRAQQLAEQTAGVTCNGCFGLEKKPDDLPECDRHDCERDAPFAIRAEAGEVNRCRRHLVENLDREMWVFYDE